jgi:hypothetical protein
MFQRSKARLQKSKRNQRPGSCSCRRLLNPPFWQLIPCQANHVSLLEKTLEEEKETDEKLTELAGQINTQANDSGDEQAGSQDKKKSRRVA